MNTVICNIPHSSLFVPSWALEDFRISQEELQKFNEKMVDLRVNNLFSFVPFEDKVVSNVSRIVVDMERFREDEKEIMSRKGMGLFYIKDDKGQVIRKKGSTYEKCLKIYDSYHENLTNKVKFTIENFGRCYILDCHSFHDEQTYMGYDVSKYPDICIGINEDTVSEEVKKVVELIEKEGYSVNINVPFSGSIVPLEFIGDTRVKSMMLEINRRIYVNSLKDFNKVKELCFEIYSLLTK